MNHLKTITMVAMETKFASQDSIFDKLSEKFYLSTTLAKKKNHHRDSRREERCSTCDIMLDQARSAQGKSDPRLSATFALR